MTLIPNESDETFGARMLRATESPAEELKQKPGDLIYFLTETQFCELQCDGRDLIYNAISDLFGREFPTGLDEFVKAALKNPNVRGLVPLSRGAIQVLGDRYHLTPISKGESPDHEKLSFDLYWK